MMVITLIELRGMISNVAIENPEHNKVIKEIDTLRDEYGDLARVNAEEIIEVLYRQE